MALDLSSVQGKQTTTETLTRFKSETVPTDDRRAVAPRADLPVSMRNAARPASQADEVRKILGMTNELGSTIVDYKEAQFAKAEEQNALIAARDSATGNVNKDVYDRSRAYRIVIADGRVHQRIAEAVPQITQDISTFIAAHADADPTKGEVPVSLEDVNARFDDHVKGLLLDKDGKPIDYGDPEANATLYRSINQLRVQVLQNAADTIKQQEQDKALTSIGSIASSELAKGSTTAIEDAIHKAGALGISPDAAKKAMLQTVLSTALDTKDESLLQRALVSLRADGKTSTWNPEERAVLTQNYNTLHNQFEAERTREAEKASATNLGNMLPDIISGKLRLTPDTLRALIAKGPQNGGITAQDAEHAMSLQNTVDARKRADEDAARSRIQFGWAQQNHVWAMQEHARTMANIRAQERFTSIQADFFSGRMTPAQAVAAVDAQFKRGDLDGKAYVAARQFFQQVPSGSKLLSMTDGQQYAFKLNEELTRMGRMSAARAKGYWPPEVWGNAQKEAQATFYRTLYSTSDPQAALTASLKTLRLKDSYIQGVVGAASASAFKSAKLTTMQNAVAKM